MSWFTKQLNKSFALYGLSRALKLHNDSSYDINLYKGKVNGLSIDKFKATKWLISTYFKIHQSFGDDAPLAIFVMLVEHGNVKSTKGMIYLTKEIIKEIRSIEVTDCNDYIDFMNIERYSSKTMMVSVLQLNPSISELVVDSFQESHYNDVLKLKTGLDYVENFIPKFKSI